MRRLALAFCLFIVGTILLPHSEAQRLPYLGAGGPTAAGGACSQYTAWNARITVNASYQAAYQTLICNLVTQGVWAKLDFFYMFATTNTTTALLNMVSTSFSGTANGSPSFTADRGYTGVDASTTVYIDTGFNASTAGGNYAQNSRHISVWSNTNTTSGASGGFVMGISNSASTILDTIAVKYTDGNAYFRMSDSATGVTNTVSTGHYVANRSGASATQGYKNASSVFTGSASSSALINGNHFILAFNSISPGIGPAFGSAIQNMASTGGGSLSAGDITNLCHETNTYLNTIASVSSGIC